TSRNRAYRRAEAAIRPFTERLIARRRAEGGGDDMLSRLVSVRDAHGHAMPDRQVRDEIIGFLAAGHQTTGAALAWTWYLLGHHPEVEQRLASELESALDGGAPSAADLDRLPYLGQVLDESMRLYPPGWAFTRTPTTDDELGGHVVPAGSVVVIS